MLVTMMVRMNSARAAKSWKTNMPRWWWCRVVQGLEADAGVFESADDGNEVVQGAAEPVEGHDRECVAGA